MTRRLLYAFIPAIIFFAAFTACSDDDTPEFHNGSGLLQISLQLPDDAPPEDAFSLTLQPAEGTPGMAHTWPSFTEFGQGQRYVSGVYTAIASTGSIDSEGFDAVWYEGRQEIKVSEGVTASVGIPVELRSAMLRLEATADYLTRFPDASATVHVPGGHFVTYDAQEARAAAFRPGKAVITVTPLSDVMLLLDEDVVLKKGVTTKLTLDYDAERQRIMLLDSVGSVLATLAADNAALTAPAPTVERIGPQNLAIPEFGDAPQPLGFKITGAGSVVLNICSPLLSVAGAPAEINLTNPDEAGRAFMAKAGMKFDGSTLVLGNLTQLLDYTDGLSPVTELTLTAVSANGRMSAPQTISITTLPIGVSITAIHSAVIGVNRAVIDVDSDVDLSREGSSLAVYTLEKDGGRQPLEIVNIEKTDKAGHYRVTIQLLPGTESVDVEFEFGGQRIGKFTVPRVSPQFSVEVDAFACSAALRIVCPDRDLRSYIVAHANVSVGDIGATVTERDAESGIIRIVGLSAARVHEVTLRMQADESGVTCTFTTEHARSLPNGDFEDVKESVKTGRIPSGGRYSQTIVPIFNSQNTGGYKCDAPEKWANTNAKTCGKGWENPNTWYMYPSVMSTTENPASGEMSVILQSGAFDPSGARIPNYLQTGEPYTPYSQNIPNIKYRAAGRLFLGTYRFNAATVTEQYDPGISFDARPSSLNGYFRYIPSEADAQDKGLVEIRVLDANGTVLSSGRVLLSAANSWTAFAIPLTYEKFGVKAARLEVTIASSCSIGSIAYESANVKTRSDMCTATSLGSKLHIDNLSLAY